MLLFQNQAEFCNQPFLLSQEQANNPASVLTDFFTDYNLSEVREILASITETCLTCDGYHFDSADKRADFIHFQKKVELLFEAVFVIDKSQPLDGSSS